VLRLLTNKTTVKGRALVSGRIGVPLKNRDIRPKIGGWTYRYAKNLKPGVSVCRKNVSAYSVGISQHVR